MTNVIHSLENNTILTTALAACPWPLCHFLVIAGRGRGPTSGT